jgi:hypothetical protein
MAYRGQNQGNYVLNSNAISQREKAQKMLTPVKLDTATFATEVPDVPEILTTEEISEGPIKRRSSQSVTSCRGIDPQLISTVTNVRLELPFHLESVPDFPHRSSSPKIRAQALPNTKILRHRRFSENSRPPQPPGQRLRILDILSQSVREPSHQLS